MEDLIHRDVYTDVYIVSISYLGEKFDFIFQSLPLFCFDSFSPSSSFSLPFKNQHTYQVVFVRMYI